VYGPPVAGKAAPSSAYGSARRMMTTPRIKIPTIAAGPATEPIVAIRAKMPEPTIAPTVIEVNPRSETSRLNPPELDESPAMPWPTAAAGLEELANRLGAEGPEVAGTALRLAAP